MGEIVQLEKKVGKYDARTRRTFDSIKTKIKYVANAIHNISDDSIDELNFLEGYLSDLIVKYRNRSWKSDKVQKKYVSMITYYNKEFKNSSVDRINIVYYELLLTYLFDIYPRLALEDTTYIRHVVEAFDFSMSEGDFATIKDDQKRLYTLTSPMIKDLINLDDDIYAPNNMVDIINMLNEGDTIPEIVSLFKRADSFDENIDLDKGIITINRIHDCYKFKNDMTVSMLQNNGKTVDEKYYHYSDSIGFLYSINHYDDKYKILFIFLINEMRKKGLVVDEELRYVSDLSDFYKFYGKDLDKMSEPQIRELVEIKYENNYPMEVIEDIRRKQKKKSKKF